MKDLTSKSLETLVDEVAVCAEHRIGTVLAREVVLHVLTAVEHPAMFYADSCTRLAEWLSKGHSMQSWMDYNQSAEISIQLGLPALWAAYEASKLAHELLSIAAQSATEQWKAPNET